MKKKEKSLYYLEHEDDTKIIKEIHHGLEQMETVFPVFTPDLNWFEQNIEKTKKNARKKLLRDLMIFWLIAITLVITTIMLVNRSPIIYLVSQAIILLSFIISNVYLHRKKQVRRQ